MESEREAGLSVYSAFVIVPPGETRRLELDLGRAVREERRLRVHHQPTVVPDDLEVKGRWRLTGSPVVEDLTLR